MLKKLNGRTKKIISIVSFSLLLLVFLILVMLTRDSSKIREIKEFVETGTKVLYITSDEKLSYPSEILNKYSIDFLEINTEKLNIFERKKLKNIINNQYIDNIIVIYQNGKVIDALIEYSSDKKVNEFLQKNGIIPVEMVENVEKIVKKSETILENEYAMIYITYTNHDKIDSQDKIFSKISEKYSINYEKIDAYLLSKTQQNKINSMLGLSEVENQILILVKDKKMIASIRGIHSENTYVETLYELNFINELEDKIKKIDYNDFKLELESEENSIILLGVDNCKVCDDIYNLLNQMVYNYDIKVNYINLENSGSKIYEEVKTKLSKIGYTDGFSLPLVVVVENNRVLDYIIGNASEQYFLEIFIKNGVIKGDVVNE